MKKIVLSLAFMLTGTLAFANNSNATVISINKQYAIELIKTSTRFELENTNPEVACLLTITFEYTDGTKETVKVLVKGSSSAELLE
jgi:deoxyribose-phosphate aldolase